MRKCACDMKGFLSFLILWMLRDKKLNGVQIAEELKKRKGSKPSPGTIYPALKELKENQLIEADEKKNYSLTKKGKQELEHAKKIFCCIFYDMGELSK